MARPSLSFLYRSDVGEINAAAWWRGLLPLAGIFVVLALGWFFVEPYADNGFATNVGSTVVVLAGNLYRIAYGIICLLLLICFYNLSAKRWRNLGRPAAFAGILPVAAAVAAALHWLEPRVDGDLPHAVVIVMDVILLCIFLWTLAELGGLRARFAALRR